MAHRAARYGGEDPYEMLQEGTIGAKIDRRYRIDARTWLTTNQWVGVHSSNVRAIRYDRRTMTLGVQFHRGSTYVYFEVPIEDARAMYLAGSIGKFVHQRLKNMFISQIAK